MSHLTPHTFTLRQLFDLPREQWALLNYGVPYYNDVRLFNRYFYPSHIHHEFCTADIPGAARYRVIFDQLGKHHYIDPRYRRLCWPQNDSNRSEPNAIWDATADVFKYYLPLHHVAFGIQPSLPMNRTLDVIPAAFEALHAASRAIVPPAAPYQPNFVTPTDTNVLWYIRDYHENSLSWYRHFEKELDTLLSRPTADVKKLDAVLAKLNDTSLSSASFHSDLVGVVNTLHDFGNHFRSTLIGLRELDSKMQDGFKSIKEASPERTIKPLIDSLKPLLEQIRDNRALQNVSNLSSELTAIREAVQKQPDYSEILRRLDSLQSPKPTFTEFPILMLPLFDLHPRTYALLDTDGVQQRVGFDVTDRPPRTDYQISIHVISEGSFHLQVHSGGFPIFSHTWAIPMRITQLPADALGLLYLHNNRYIYRVQDG